MFQRVIRILNLGFYLLLAVNLLTTSNIVSSGEPIESARVYTRPIEFDYVSWSIKAALLKLQSGAVGIPGYLLHGARKQAVMQYLYYTERILQGEDQLNHLYADPSVTDKESASAHLRAELEALNQRQAQLAPLAEAVLQEQVKTVLADLGLTVGGQTIPPVLYHSSAVPMGLIVSPRNHIEQLANISLQPDLPLDQQDTLENEVDSALNVSSLVVPIGGVGVYPTMVMRSTDLSWLLDTISHEWTHNYLTLRPLGALYNKTPRLRTMNETTASIVGNEVGTLVLKRYYPELAASVSDPMFASHKKTGSNPKSDPPTFDYRAEMHETRVTADKLLAEGKIVQAETYMEARRQVFWDHGYAIRKLNQAYFAFYGAYADTPGGAAGEDPVGPAVRALRKQSASLADFVNSISWMTSFEQLQAVIAAP